MRHRAIIGARNTCLEEAKGATYLVQGMYLLTKMLCEQWLHWLSVKQAVPQKSDRGMRHMCTCETYQGYPQRAHNLTGIH